MSFLFSRNKAPPEATKPCVACGASIPSRAELCSVCKTYQRPWKTRIQFFSSITALLVATISLAAWTASQLPHLKAQFFPRTNLVILRCNSLDGGVVASFGDDTVFLSELVLSPVYHVRHLQWFSQIFPINSAIKPGHFLQIRSPWPKGFDAVFDKHVSATEFPILFNKAVVPSDPDCVRIVMFIKNDPRYRDVVREGPTVTFLPSVGYLEYFSATSPSAALRMPVAAAGAFMTRATPECGVQ